MADTQAPHRQPNELGHPYGHHYSQQTGPTDAIKSILPERGPSASHIVAVVTLFSLGGLLLFLAGLTLAGTILGLAITTPLFILFSPVLVPVALIIALAVTGFLMSGAFGLTGMSSMAWILNYMRQVTERVCHHLEEKAQQMSDYMDSAKCCIQVWNCHWLAVTTPLFILFSPVLVPAALTIVIAVTGFLMSGVFGLTGMSSIAWILNYLRQVTKRVCHQLGEKAQQMSDYMDYTKCCIQDTTGTIGQMTKGSASADAADQ